MATLLVVPGRSRPREFTLARSRTFGWVCVVAVLGGCLEPGGTDGASTDGQFGAWIDESEALNGVECQDGAVVCSNPASPAVGVYSGLYRVGASDLARGEVAQTFTGVAGTPSAVRLKLRLLRDLPTGTSPLVRVAVREVTGGVVPTGEGASLWTGSLAADTLGRRLAADVDVALAAVGSPAPMSASSTYALVVSADAPATGTTYVGVAAHKTATYPQGQALRRAQRRALATDAFVDGPFLTSGDDLDLSFSLLAGAAATCTDGLKNGAESDIDCGGTCAGCAAGRACSAPGDCASGACTSGVCEAAPAHSVRFSGAQYLNRTPAAAGNRQKWTLSFWVKRGMLANGTYRNLFGSWTGDPGQYTYSYFDSADRFYLSYSNVNGVIRSNNVFRDTSAWYHIVIVWDAGNATPALRYRAFSNGVEMSYQTHDTTAGRVSSWNSASNQVIAAAYNGTGQADLYLAEIAFVDGQALEPTSFGHAEPTTGQWLPQAYTGSYGSTGYYLPFSDGTSTGTLGRDASGLGNDWTLMGATRGGAGDCWLADAPERNFATFDPLVAGATGISHGLLDATSTARSTIPTPTSGVWYWEMTANASGVTAGALTAAGTAFTAPIASATTSGFRYTPGNSLLEVTTNGSTWTTVSAAISGPVHPYSTGGSVSANFGQRPFAYSVAASLLNASFLPAGTVTLSGTFTGNGSADGPMVWINGVPLAMTINGNAVTFGTQADRTAGGVKLRSSAAGYNASGTNSYAVTAAGPVFRVAGAQTNP